MVNEKIDSAEESVKNEKDRDVPSSKKYFTYLVIFEALVILFIAFMETWLRDVGAMHWVISTLAAEISIYSGFYLWKSKNENRSKYAQKYVMDVADKYGVDAALKFAQIVLKD